jgi:hypothetical protein
MNKLITILLFLTVAVHAIGQETAQSETMPAKDPKVAVTIGILQGGGGLLGADFEFMVAPRLSLQAGAGITSFGAGINYHLKPQINSSMISLSYWHQGIGDSYTQSLLGPSFVFRARKIFTAQLGLGYLLEEGPAWPENTAHPSAMLLYSIGIYLPIK